MAEPTGETQGPARGEQPLARAALARRKLLDAAAALPLAGLALLVSPLLDVFAGDGRVLGLPAGAVYVFAVWFGLIALAARLARRLAAEGDAGEPGGGSGGGGGGS
jgi:hypothetical protein